MMPVVHQLRCTSQAFPLAGRWLWFDWGIVGGEYHGIPNLQNMNMERLTCLWRKKTDSKIKSTNNFRKNHDGIHNNSPKKNQWNLPRTINNWWSPAKQNQPLKVTKDPIHMLRYQKPTMKVPTKHADTACQAENISSFWNYPPPRMPSSPGWHYICRYSNPKHPTDSFATSQHSGGG